MNGRNSHQQAVDAYRNLESGAAIIDSSIQGYKAGKYAALAYHGYKLGRKLLNSFSQKEKQTMAPLPRKRKTSNPLATPKKTPTKKARFVIKGKQRRQLTKSQRQGASGSHSAGFFNKPKATKSTLDSFMLKGIVSTREVGSVIAGSALLKYQTLQLMHATHGKDQLFIDIGLAMAKAIAYRVCGINPETVNEPIVGASGRTIRCTFSYRTSPTGALAYYDMDLVATKTVAQFASDISTWWKGLAQTYTHLTLCTLGVYRQNVLTTPAVGWEVIGVFNLKRSSISYYIKSSMKIQNRTINSAGNDETDDVDNVPVYGKVYDGTGNYFLVNDTYYVPSVTLQANYFMNGYDATSPLAEPPNLSMMQRCKAVGKAHLDPGQIKTSVLTDRGNININKLNSIIGTSESTTNTLPLGKFRVFLFEKMIQAVATTDTTALKIAYEVDFKSGFIFNLAKHTPTTALVTLSPE
jgi:hypothetical protein